MLAQDKLGKAAKHSHLVQRAERNTTKMLQGFLGKLGYTDINVVYKDPTRGASAADDGHSPPRTRRRFIWTT